MALDIASATAVLRGLTQKFDKGVRDATPFYPRLSMRIPSTRSEENYGILGDVPAVREWLGDRKAKELRAGTYLLKNKKWESTLRVEKDHLSDDQYGMYDGLLEALGRRAARHPDTLLFQTIVAGESTAAFDGQFFFDTDHAWGDSGSQSNDLTFAAATGTTPTVAEFKGAYDQAVAALLGFKDDQGEMLVQPVVETQSDLLVVVPIALRQTATEALKAPLTSTGGTNVVIDNPQIVASGLLTDATKFYVFNMGDVIKPFVFQDREPIRRGTKGLDDLERKDVLFMTQSRYAIGYAAWWNAVLTTFT